MILFAFLLVAMGGAGVEVRVEVGWAGRAVVSVVNPVWVSLSNPDPSLFSGELRLSGKIGSPWRGEAQRTLLFPVLLAPGGHTRLVLPWPVELGSTTLKVEVCSGERVVFSKEIQLYLELGRLTGAVGPPMGPVEILLSPADLPLDPLLLWPFSQLELALEISDQARAVLQAWSMFLGGKSSVPSPWGVLLQGESFRQALQAYRPSPPLWSALVPGLFVYLVILGFVLSRYSRGDVRVLLVFIGVSLSFALIYGLSRDESSGSCYIKADMVSQGFTEFCLELWGGLSWREEMQELPGFWVELLPERGWEGLDLHWVYSQDGWETKVTLAPGRPRLFFRLAQGVIPARDGETVSPPNWLVSALRLPWEKAHVTRATFVRGGSKTEFFQILLP